MSQADDFDFSKYPVKSFKVTDKDYLKTHPMARESHPNICVAANVFNKDGRLLLIQRAAKCSYPLTWQVPSGKYEKGETIIEGTLRELKEEAGIKGKVVDPVGALLFTSSKGKKSQEIHFIVDAGSKPNVRIDPDECNDYRWVTKKEAKKMDLTLPDLVWPMIKAAFEQVNGGSS